MKALYTVLLCIAYCVTGLGQKVSGQLINSSNEPLPEAYIFINNSDNHVHSNSLGYFEIKKAAVGDTLGVTYMGYQEVAYVLSESDFENEIQITLKAEPIRLDQVYVDNSVKSVNRISKIDLEANPVQSSQEVLRKVPGLFIGQHAGGGKAEQIFLRGFDIDHGTDISISVDGLPVNMVSHAHGQGYSDLHFLIPEVIRGVDFAKGPYYAEHGNFTTAGYVDFHTLDRLGESSVGLEIGRFNTLRTKAMFDVIDQKDRNAYIASEFISSDGPFESSQNFNRMNIMGKFTTRYENNDQLALTISRFQSKWDASGQIPVRAVESGLISRFGAIDDTEGGQTSRSNILIEHTKEISPSSFVKSRAYYSHYDFELFSNFTFFLKDEENGDQIRQFEDRNIYGLNTTFFKNLALASGNLEIQLGGGFRYDDVNDNELAHTVNRRTTIEQLALGDVDETNIDLFANVEFEIGRWMINPGLRLDAFKFDYVDRLKPEYTSLSETKSFLSPKLNI
ncbi:MAG: TonB-dependent receptor plug domain-containing protein, partial [Saprospiraceae bacterium]|nr:TonB-dependent receptor plug domain-containing protein [Saprospiraceae bacterium]